MDSFLCFSGDDGRGDFSSSFGEVTIKPGSEVVSFKYR